MNAQSATPIVPVQPAGNPPTVIAPDIAVFALRAQRFDALAVGHALGDWLRLMAALARAQDAALRAFPLFDLPDAAEHARAYAHRMPLIPAQGWQRPGVWREVTRRIAADLLAATDLLPDAGRRSLGRLAALDDGSLDSLAERVLHTELHGVDAGLLPFVGAGLQVLWTAAAIRLGSPRIVALDVPGVCPCCGFLPVASVVKGAGDVANLRFLHCALCNTEWHLVRVKCAACDSTEDISYRQLEGEGGLASPAVFAETCEACSSYLKIGYIDKGPFDPVADDLATLALDILVDEAGYSRAGPNLLLVPGG